MGGIRIQTGEYWWATAGVVAGMSNDLCLTSSVKWGSARGRRGRDTGSASVCHVNDDRCSPIRCADRP